MIRDQESDFQAFDTRNPTDGASGWWATRCRWCGKWVTKYDWSKQESLGLASRCHHECDGTGPSSAV